jgi:WD40 repeat protein
VVEAASGREAAAFAGQTHPIDALAFSPDGRRLAASGGNLFEPGELKVWDVNRGQVVLDLRGHTVEVWSVAWSPDGSRLASCGGDGLNPEQPGEVKLWDAQTGEEVLALPGQEAMAASVAFSPDGHRLAAVEAYHRITVWDATPLQK